MSVALSVFVVLLVTAPGLLAEPPPALPTAVFTLDVERRTFDYEDIDSFQAKFQRWVRSCTIAPAGDLFALRCPPARPPRRSEKDPAELIHASLALFRDLDETLYLAGCPLLENSSESVRAERPGDERKRIVASATGIVSPEVEQATLKIVIRGRQLAFSLFEVRSKERTISSPYELAPSRRAAAVGPPTASPAPAALPPPAEPSYSPPSLENLARGRPSARASADSPLAKTSLRTGRLMISCPSSKAHVYVDGEYFGTCPVQRPLLEGRHSLLIRRPNMKDFVRDPCFGARLRHQNRPGTLRTQGRQDHHGLHPRAEARRSRGP